MLATFPVLPSSRPYRDVDIGDVSRSTELWPLTGLFATGADLHRRYTEGGMSRRDNSSVRRNDHDGHLVPQGHKPGRRSPPGGRLVPQGRKLGRDGISDRPPMPLQGQNMSRRDTSSVGTAFTDGSQRPFRGKTSPPPPIVPVQIPEINRLGQMPDLNVRAAVEVGDGAGHLQDVGR